MNIRNKQYHSESDIKNISIYLADEIDYHKMRLMGYRKRFQELPGSEAGLYRMADLLNDYFIEKAILRTLESLLSDIKEGKFRGYIK